MKNTLFYLLLLFLMACGNSDKQVSVSTGSNVDVKKDSCYCDSDGNLNLISDSALAARRVLWRKKLKNLYPGQDTTLLPQGFNISIADIQALADLLKKDKYPDPKSVMAYFTFDSQGAADSGKITAVFVPVYSTAFSPCKKDCKSNQFLNEGIQTQTQTINIDFTTPCPPVCGQ